MRAFLASFYKDLKLILSSAGVLAVLLPLLLLPALALGMGGSFPRSGSLRRGRLTPRPLAAAPLPWRQSRRTSSTRYIRWRTARWR